MFQLYRDGIEDLLGLSPKEKDNSGIKRKKKEHNPKLDAGTLKITLAEHSTTGLVHVSSTRFVYCLLFVIYCRFCYIYYCIMILYCTVL